MNIFFAGRQPNGLASYYADAPPTLASDLGGVFSQVGDEVIIVNSPSVPTNAASPSLFQCVTSGRPGVWVGDFPDAKATGVVTNAQLLALFTTPVQVIPAYGPGTATEIVTMFLENVYLTGAFAGGGAIALYYGNTLTNPAVTPVASTFLTAPAANQCIMTPGTLPSLLTTAVFNTAIFISNATANFTSGGGSMQYRIQYRVHAGLV